MWTPRDGPACPLGSRIQSSEPLSSTLQPSGASPFHLSNEHLPLLLEELGDDKTQPGNSLFLSKNGYHQPKGTHSRPGLICWAAWLKCSQISGPGMVSSLFCHPESPKGNSSYPTLTLLPFSLFLMSDKCLKGNKTLGYWVLLPPSFALGDSGLSQATQWKCRLSQGKCFPHLWLGAP